MKIFGKRKGRRNNFCTACFNNHKTKEFSDIFKITKRIIEISE